MFPQLIEKLKRRRDLSESEAAAAMAEIMEGRATPAQMSGFLIALSMKGERPAEMIGLARTMRANAVKLSKTYEDTFDTCGTGGDGCSTVNVSSLAALVVAACGVRVAKHGNRSVSSKCGSADLFEAMGVDVAGSPAAVERCLVDVGIAFFFAQTFHPSMRHVGPTRRELSVRTAFNLLGPLTNPAGARRQLIGVPRPEHTDLLARTLARLGTERAWVVHGADGVDEISTSGHTKVSECRSGHVRSFYVHPSDFGITQGTLDKLRLAGSEESVSGARSVLAGERGPARDIVVINAAAALLVAEVARSPREAAALAEAALDEGRAANTLDRLARCSRGEPE